MTTSLKKNTTAASAPPTTTNTPAPTPPTVTTNACGFSDCDESSSERADSACESKARAQSKSEGSSVSAWQEGVPVFKSTEGQHFLRLISFPGEPNKVADPDDSTRFLPRWWMRYTLYRVSDKDTKQDSGPLIPKPGENLLLKARIALYQNPNFKARLKDGSFKISASERIVFLALPFSGAGFENSLLLDLPISRAANPKKPSDTPKRQVGDDIRDLPRLREDDPITNSKLAPGVLPPLKYGQIYGLERGRIIRLEIQGQRENMQRTVEVKSAFPLSQGGQILPEYLPILTAAAERFGSKPIEDLLRYASKEDQLNWVSMLAPQDMAQVSIRAMGGQVNNTAPAEGDEA